MHFSTIPGMHRSLAPMYDVDGSGGGGSPAPAPNPAPAPASISDGPMSFSQLDQSSNPITKALNDAPADAPIGQVEPPAPAPGTETPPPATPDTTPTPDALSAVMEEIKKLNPTAAEKYKTPEAIAKSLLSQEKTMTQLFTEKAQAAKTMENLNAELAKLREEATKTPPAPIQEQTPEQIAEANEKELAEMMDNPLAYRKKLIDEAIEATKKATTDAIVSSDAVTKEATTLLTSFVNATDDVGNLLHPDFEAYAQEMSDLINQFPELKANTAKLGETMEFAYNYVKGQKAAAAPKVEPVDPKTLLSDPEFLKNNVYNNEAIKTAFISTLAQDIRDGKPPVVISGQPGGTPPASPPKTPTSFKEAGDAAAKHYGWGK